MIAARIAIVGGGPGGLFFAALAKSANPRRKVVVLERNRADDTFGFGVVFSDRTMAAIDDADPVLRNALREHGVRWDPIEVRLKGERILAGGNGMAAVVRRTLLALLRDRALEVGVELHYEYEADPAAVLREGYDLVVAADGANSRLRNSLPDRFGVSVEVASAKFIWFGTTYGFGGLTFVHERGPEGVFAVHGYPIGGGLGTFIVETDEGSWHRAGLDEFDVTAPPGPSDEKSRDYLQNLFTEQIDGHGLLVNNSRWGNFRTLRTTHWHTRTESGAALVLLGDAAHTAHFSVGSGTKMAMEDAVSLAAALDGHTSLDEALAAHESARRPLVEKIQDSARPSLSWWEHFGRYHDTLEPWQFAYHFLSRSLSDAKLRMRDSGFVNASHARWCGIHHAAPLQSPAPVAELIAPRRTVVVEADEGVVGARLGDVILPLLTSPPQTGPWGVLVTAPHDESALPAAFGALRRGQARGASLAAVRDGTPLTSRLISEEARMGLKLPSLLIEPAGTSADDALTAVLSGRCDLVGADAATVATWLRAEGDVDAFTDH
jgi:2-polyprenyl-6-methoxyphenol hydroxylase-like FAD-dependent oxidoreductase